MRSSNSLNEIRNQRGMALVLVLGMLVLVAVLVVAFLSSVTTELQSAKSFASSSDARVLADSAVNIVISQIQDATSTPRLAWASQPGMIRTYDDTGAAVTAFKLYSSGELRVAGAFDANASVTAEVPGNWASQPQRFADLNKPVASGGSLFYPIIHPAAVAKDASEGAPLRDASDTPIEGCFLDTTNTATALSATQTNPVPMPVRWLYVLKDGSLAAMDSATNKIPGAGEVLPDGTRNTITGRIAFWADDETAKVNVNTASEGTFWDRPWTSSNPFTGYEASLYKMIPAQNEFQRFPGHPAMTSLSTIFPRGTDETIQQFNERMYGIIPRISEGGTRSGTVVVNYATPPITYDSDRLFASVDEFLFKASGAPRVANPKSASSSFSEVDIEKTRFCLTANSRSPEVNLFNKPRVTLWPLQIDPEPLTGKETQNSKDKLIAFCSTIGSEANGKPYYLQRYSTYNYAAGSPNIRSATAPYSPTQNPKPSSQSPTMDWYLTQDGKPSTAPSRNQELYSYLQSLLESPIPGLGGRFAGNSANDKYPLAVRDQILTQIFDYIRSNINLTSAGIKTTSGVSGYSYAPFSPTGGSVVGQFQIVPLSLPNGTKGFGQFPTITQAALIFYRTDNVLVNGTEQTAPRIVHDGTLSVTEGTTPKMRAFLILQPFTTSPGPPPWSANLRIRIQGLDQFSAAGISLGFPADAVNLITARDGQSNATAYTGLELFTQYWPLRIKNPGLPSVGSIDEEQFYPFCSAEIPLTGTTFNFAGGRITIKLYSGYSTTLNDVDLVQTINMEFPSAMNWPIPTISYSRGLGTRANGTNPPIPTTTVTQYNDILTRFGSLSTGGMGVQQDGQHNPLPLVVRTNGAPNTGDTVRAIEARYGGPAKGDYRVFSGLQTVPDVLFGGHGLKDPPTVGRSYDSTAANSRQLHSLMVDSGSGQGMTSFSGGYYTGGVTSATAGKLLASANYYNGTSNPKKAHKSPVAPVGLAQAEMANGALGDWDTGVGSRRDGPFTNKADLGHVGSNVAAPNGYYNAQGFDRSSNNAVITDIGASFSPNRQISSAVSFGSLPTGIDPSNVAQTKPWQTFLFCNNPLAGFQHPGFGTPSSGTKIRPPYRTPPDHAVLDLFTMPIVEPYAISEPFSTAGKVNMNYQIVPFTYLKRSTGIRAVLKSTRMMAIPTTSAPNYKISIRGDTGAVDDGSGQQPPPDFRYTINADEQIGTLAGFEQRFDLGDIFRSSSEICDIYLVPKYLVNTTTPAPGNPTYDTMETWWETYKLTGDNVREQPYGHIYPRLTTKSNTYMVHVTAQSLKKSKNSPQDEFVEGLDQVNGEFRGSFVIERTLDPNSDSLVKPKPGGGWDPATETDPDAMVGPYKYRVLSSKRFAP